MPGNTFNAYEALRISIGMERDGIAFYEALAGAVKEEDVRKLAMRLAEEGQDHVRRLQQMIDLEGIGQAWSADDLRLIDDYVNATIRREAFMRRVAAANAGKYVAGLDDALAPVIHLERLTVQYYRKLLFTCTHEAGKRVFAQLIEEEKRHAADLAEVRLALSPEGA